MPKDIPEFAPTNYGLGALKDLPDRRDYQIASFLAPTAVLPSSVSYRSGMTSIKNQGQLGSCVAFGTCAAKEYYDKKEYNQELDFSEQWLYGECKKEDGYQGEGTYPKLGLEILLRKGVCEEYFLPYEAQYPPSNSTAPGANENAVNYKIKAYAKVVGLDYVKQALYQFGPMTGSILVWKNFYNIQADGIAPTPPNEDWLGAHLMCIVGYDDNIKTPLGNGVVTFKNSWSPYFGDKGYVHIPYSVFDTYFLGGWSMVDITGSSMELWSDWPKDASGQYQEELAARHVMRKGIFTGFPDNTFRPWPDDEHPAPYGLVLRRQVDIVMNRLAFLAAGKPLPSYTSELKYNDYEVATRQWTKDKYSQLDFNSQRWEEPLTRYQFLLLVARYMLSKGL